MYDEEGIKSMINVLFICHGNICRSPMAEFLFKDMVMKKGLSQQISIASAATSREEIGNPVHRGTVQKLAQYGISTKGKYARQIRKEKSVVCWIFPTIPETLRIHGTQGILM